MGLREHGWVKGSDEKHQKREVVSEGVQSERKLCGEEYGGRNKGTLGARTRRLDSLLEERILACFSASKCGRRTLTRLNVDEDIYKYR